MGDDFVKTARRPRADSIRNRERLLEAAAAVFSAGGPEASLEAVAKRAGVGIGTLYRHFPTREAEPVDALRRWLHANVQLVATKRGMLAALALAAYGSSELWAYSFETLTKAVDLLLKRAIGAGEVRADITAEELLRALIALCYMNDRPGWQTTVLHLVDIFVDGLRVR